jgi:hypothetical protein
MTLTLPMNFLNYYLVPLMAAGQKGCFLAFGSEQLWPSGMASYPN